MITTQKRFVGLLFICLLIGLFSCQNEPAVDNTSTAIPPNPTEEEGTEKANSQKRDPAQPAYHFDDEYAMTALPFEVTIESLKKEFPNMQEQGYIVSSRKQNNTMVTDSAYQVLVGTNAFLFRDVGSKRIIETIILQDDILTLKNDVKVGMTRSAFKKAFSELGYIPDNLLVVDKSNMHQFKFMFEEDKLIKISYHDRSL